MDYSVWWRFMVVLALILVLKFPARAAIGTSRSRSSR